MLPPVQKKGVIVKRKTDSGVELSKERADRDHNDRVFAAIYTMLYRERDVILVGADDELRQELVRQAVEVPRVERSLTTSLQVGF